jgi:hypothetical protein
MSNYAFLRHWPRYAQVLPAGIEPTSAPSEGAILSIERREVERTVSFRLLVVTNNSFAAANEFPRPRLAVSRTRETSLRPPPLESTCRRAGLFVSVDSPGIGPGPRQCECRVMPLYYEPCMRTCEKDIANDFGIQLVSCKTVSSDATLHACLRQAPCPEGPQYSRYFPPE